MNIKKLIKRILLLVVAGLLAYGISYAWRAFPIISGYGAKNMCSCVMLAGRSPADVLRNELGGFPLRLGTFEANYSDSSATGSVFGLASRKAIYRKGMGCSLVVEITEEDFRAQKVNLPARPAINQDTLAWPEGNLVKDTVPTNVDQAMIARVLDSAFAEHGADRLRRTRAVVIVYDGKLIAERYAEGFNRHSRHTGWSMTKSVTNALVGILVKQGKLNPDAPAPIDLWQHDGRKKITLNDLMHASSGLNWEENYGGPSGATNMLFKKKDMGVYAADVAPLHKPGEVFYYSSGTTNIISRIVREAVGDDGYYKFPYEALFYKTGMLNTTLEADAGGTFVGSSYCFAPARDWARFGLLYLNDGVFNGERILPEGWVKYTTTPAKGADRGQYGAQFWLNAGAAGNPQQRYYPDVPTDLFWADGFEGQNVFIIPSKKLVVVKLSLSQGDYLDDNMFLAGIIEAVEQKK
jgi:CubicO group peptidase (beta-lactamase class C family)